MEAENVAHLKFNQAVELLMSKWESECVNERNGKSKQKKMKIKKKWQRALYPDDTPRDFRAGDLFQPKHVKALDIFLSGW